MKSPTTAQRKEVKSQEHSNKMEKREITFMLMYLELEWREQGKQHGLKNGMGTSATSSVKILAQHILGIFWM